MLPKIRQAALRANKAHNLIYLNNPKVGCSTVKFNLWQAISPETLDKKSNIHGIALSPFSNSLIDLDWVKTAKIFTFVRNPYTRALSAYLNKIKKRETEIWGWFCKRYGLSRNAEVSFEEFLDLIGDDHPEFLDPHWRPQHLNVLYPFIQPNVIGYLEDMDHQLPKVLSWALSQNILLTARRSNHSTRANTQLTDYYSTATMRRVQKIYADDFAYFGYPGDLAAAHLAPQTTEISDHTHEGLALLQSYIRNKDTTQRKAQLSQMKDFAAKLPASSMVDDWLLLAQLSLLPPDALKGATLRHSKNLADGHEFLRRKVKALTLS